MKVQLVELQVPFTELKLQSSLRRYKLLKMAYICLADQLMLLSDANDAAVARHSLDAQLQDWRDGRQRLCRDWLKDMINAVMPLAHELELAHRRLPQQPSEGPVLVAPQGKVPTVVSNDFQLPLPRQT